MGSSDARTLDLLDSLLGGAAPAGFMPEFVRRSFEAFGESLAPVLGVPELLAALGQPYCVASNGPREKMRFTLGHTGLLPRFEGRLFSAQDVRLPKPAPDLFLHAARSLGAQARHCVVVEDSATGVTAARAAGMRVLGYAAMGQADKLRRAGADVVFSNMAELPALLPSA